nr:immunoglobulin heavy chain junction region [Mus musculus]MBK4185850.1 immunoglobulin heavy chain junction region [Mus musculus]
CARSYYGSSPYYFDYW